MNFTFTETLFYHRYIFLSFYVPIVLEFLATTIGDYYLMCLPLIDRIADSKIYLQKDLKIEPVLLTFIMLCAKMVNIGVKWEEVW